MSNHKPVILLTGQPGIGKTTAVRKVIGLIEEYSGGFYTREVLSNDRRIGFEIITLEGNTACLATKNLQKLFPNEILFGSYKINLDTINLVAVPSLIYAIKNKKVVIVDEIGPMEIFSGTFCETILDILKINNTLVFGTIVQHSNPFADIVKTHPRVTLKTITLENRDKLALEVYSELNRYL